MIKWTYNSNSIEGSTLTLSETKVVLEDGITIGGKPLNQHLEAINHKEAILFLKAIVQSNETLTERTIKDIHVMILRGIELISSDYVRIVIKSKRADYYQVLDHVHTTGDNTDFIIFVGNIVRILF